jgi:hypothetical protein
MLQNENGLPATETPPDYPIEIDWDGILVDDPDHPDDIIRRVQQVLAVIWGERAAAIEQEACAILGVKELRDYFRKVGKGGFWDDHVKRYSKSRRKAPIYWLLQSSKGNYALWLYYHRLDKDLYYKALVNYVEPKLRLEENKLSQLQVPTRRLRYRRRRSQTAGKRNRPPGSVPQRTARLPRQTPRRRPPQPHPRPQRRRHPQHRPPARTRPLERSGQDVG